MNISIVTPSYNQGQFLSETIASVLSQEGDFEIDYLIIDGGSDDGSVEIIKRFERLLNEQLLPVKCNKIRYRWISEKDRGQSDALMKGFRLAQGEILAWLNSDDLYLPGTLRSVNTFFMNNQEVSLLYGDAHYADPDGKIIGRYPTEDFDFDKLAYFNFFCQPSTFFRREAFMAVGGIDEDLHYAMDFDLFIRIGKRFSCRHIPEFLSIYRLHETSKTMSIDDLYKNHEEALGLALKYFDWAPLNRVYGSCSCYALERLPDYLKKFRLFVIFATCCCAVFRSIKLNRGLCRKDLKLLNRNNFRKLFKKRIEILQG